MPEVTTTIETIKNLNRLAEPIFLNAMSSIGSEIKSRKVEISKYQDELLTVEKSCEKYEKDCEKSWKTLSNKENLNYSEFEKDFISKNKDYEDILNYKQHLKDSIDSMKQDVEKRNSFKNKLKKCTEKISKFLEE